ncbi:MAG: 4-hydroxybutyrate CoA-transferase, partial [Bacteroidetes bacterium]|nr:4-hydroxybutyrate CoA-transferase [Bacteroidota bacterium]
MDWSDEFKKKSVSAIAAVNLVKSRDKVFTSGNASTPYVLLNALASRKDELHEVEITHVLLIGDDPLSKPEMAGHFRHNSLFVGPADRKAVNDGRADYIPIFLH